MKVCVTGGRGFIGARLNSVLVKAGHTVVALSRNTLGLDSNGVMFFRGDLLAKDCPLVEFVAGCDVLFHCAGELSNTDVMRSLHVDGTKRLLEAVCAESGRSRKKIHWVQLSSVGVYGPPAKASMFRVVTEESAVAPVGEYEVTKYLSDELVLSAAREEQITCTILRPSNVFGCGMPNQSLIGLIGYVQKRLFFYVGPPGAIATYVHVDDVVDALMLCAVHPAGRSGEVFNLSNDCSWEALIDAIAVASHVSPPLFRFPEWFVRVGVSIASQVIGRALTHKRIDALVARTSYPVTKLVEKCGFKPKRFVPDVVKELVSDVGSRKNFCSTKEEL